MSGLVEGSCTKQECIDGKERTSVCGCVFQCQDWGKGKFYWIRVKDCEKHIKMVKKAVK